MGVAQRVPPPHLRHAEHHGVGERAVWQYLGGDCGRDDDAAGCAEDAHDAGEGEDAGGAVAEADTEGEWTEGVLCGDWAADSVD